MRGGTLVHQAIERHIVKHGQVIAAATAQLDMGDTHHEVVCCGHVFTQGPRAYAEVHGKIDGRHITKTQMLHDAHRSLHVPPPAHATRRTSHDLIVQGGRMTLHTMFCHAKRKTWHE